MNQRFLITLIILAGIGSITAVSAYSGSISAAQGNFNNVLITGTCSGCGGEASYTTYTLNINKTLSASAGRPIFIQVGSDKSTIAGDNNPQTVITDSTGIDKTIIPPQVYLTANTGKNFDQSINGEYKVAINNTGSTIDVFKNNVILQHITIDTTHTFFSKTQLIVGISSNGKYIGLFGPETTDTLDQLQIWQGS